MKQSKSRKTMVVFSHRTQNHWTIILDLRKRNPSKIQDELPFWHVFFCVGIFGLLHWSLWECHLWRGRTTGSLREMLGAATCFTKVVRSPGAQHSSNIQLITIFGLKAMVLGIPHFGTPLFLLVEFHWKDQGRVARCSGQTGGFHIISRTEKSERI